MKPVVFLSHSSGDNPRAIALREALLATGKLDIAFDVTDLRHGEAYRPQLYRWIMRCQAAVLLLTGQVMARPDWVLQEAMLLRARTELEGAGFRLFIVQDTGISQHADWPRFAPLELPAIQRFELADPADPIDAAVAAITTGLDAVVAFDEQYESRLAELIFDALEPFMDSLAARRQFAEWLPVDDALWQGIVPTHASLQALIARRLAAGRLGGERLLGLFQRLQQHLDERERFTLLNVLQSHWVPLSNATRLADALAGTRAAPATGEAPRNVVLLHTEWAEAERVAGLHRERRFQPYSQLGSWANVELGNENEGVFAERVRAALVSVVYDGVELTELDIVADLSGTTAGGPTFVHVAGVQTLAHLLPVARRYWPCVFVLSVDAAACERLSRELSVPPIAPRSAGEAAHMLDLARARAFAGRPKTGPAARSPGP